MKKQLILLLSIVVVLGLLGGGLWWLNGYQPAPKSPSSTEAERESLVETTSAEIQKLTVKNTVDSYVIQNSANGAVIEGMDKAPLNGSLSACLSAVANLSGTVVEREAKDLAAFGLNAPPITVTVDYTGGSKTLLLGNKTPTGDGYYAKLPDNSTVYMVGYYGLTYLAESRMRYVDPMVTAATQEGTAPNAFTLSGSVRPAPIMVAQGVTTEEMKGFGLFSYLITAPKQRSMDTEKGSALFPSFFTITADEVVSYLQEGQKPTEFDLDAPYSSLEYTWLDGEGKLQRCKLSTSAPVDGKVYLVKEGVPVVYRVSADALLWLNTQYEDLVSRLQVMPMIDDVSYLTLEGGGKTWKYSLTGEEDKLVVLCDGKTLVTDNFRKFYQCLIGLPAEKYAPEPPAEGAKTVLKVTYQYRDGSKPDIQELVEGPALQLYLAVNGEAEFLTKSKYLDTILQNAQALQNDQTITPLY
ncbi:MAG: DUF4340 domain-containing protein [Angelakisella sp.]